MSGGTTIVDEIDYEWAMQWNWTSRDSKGLTYVERTICATAEDGRRTRQRIHLHREILARKLGHREFAQVDHRDHDGRNNTRDNLRPATNSQNMGNRRKQRGSSRYKGVTWHRATNLWRAQIGIGRRVHIGVFASEADAARAYDRAAKAHFGEFALVNFPDEEQRRSA